MVKLLVSGEDTNGLLSLHLIRLKAGRRTGSGVHDDKWEAHLVLCGHGECIMDKGTVDYSMGVTNLIPPGSFHEVVADDEGDLYVLCVFSPALY